MTVVIALRPAYRAADGLVPALAALAAHLAARGRRVHLALAAPGPAGRIALDAAAADPMLALLAAHAPLWTAEALPAAVAAASGADGGADAVLAGGALPGAALRLLLASARVGLGRAWPLGPLAAPRGKLLRAADLSIVIGTRAEIAHARTRDPALQAGIAAVPALLATGMDWAGERLLLAAPAPDLPGLAALLTAAGASVAATAPLDPAGLLAPALRSRLMAEARARRARIVAPEAEAARMPAAFRREVLALPVRLTFPQPAPLDAALAQIGL
ncbi:MAG: hypothetical protein ACK4TB_03750 [Gemmobacter sp.]